MHHRQVYKALITAILSSALLFTGCTKSEEVPNQINSSLEKIKISYQPGLYTALPIWVAEQRGLWAEAGLDAEYSTYTAGVPQMAASASKSWDVGSAGLLPAIIGNSRFGVKTIGISNDESATTSIYATEKVFQQFSADKNAIKSETIYVTQNSNADFVLKECLKSFGINKNSLKIVNLGASEIISAMAANKASVAAVWAPYGYILENKAASKELCNGSSIDTPVLTALVARSEFAKEYPERVEKFIQVYLETWNWLLNNRTEAKQYMKEFYALGGVVLSDAEMEREFNLRKILPVAEQIQWMNKNQGTSKFEQIIDKNSEFLFEAGVITKITPPDQILDSSFMNSLNKD